MSTYSNNNIEKMSVGLLLAYINSSTHLEGDINYNDKELLWDGDIKVYSDSKNHSVDTYIDRIPVQIKGHEVKKYPGKCKYSIPIKNLRQYKRDGGLIYFEIQLKNNRNYRLFYKILLPVNIENYLKASNGQETTTIKFDKLNLDKPTQMKSICDFFLKQRQKQIGKSIIDIQQLETIKNLTIEGLSQNGIPDFFDDEKFAYIDINGEVHPTTLPDVFTISTPIFKDISINGKRYFDNFIIEESSERIPVYKFGNCISIAKKNNSKKITITFDGDNLTLKQIFDEQDFIIDFLNNPILDSNGESFISIETSTSFVDFAKKIKSTINQVNTFSRVLNHIGLDLNIPLSSISSTQKNTLLKLNEILEGKCNDANLGFMHIKVGTKRALILLFNDGKIQKCFNAFDKFVYETLSFTSKLEGTGHIPISPYFILNAKEVVSADNFCPEAVSNNILSLKIHSEIVSNAIYYLLDLLKAYDELQDKRILDVAESFYQNDSIMNSGIAMIINKFQIIKRKRELTDTEKEEIIKLKNDNSSEKDIICCANLLLDNITEFEFYFKKLDKAAKENFSSYPILKFYPGDILKLN